jgi:MoCo/4Fe-4S cofactor protein with predicted Tat translocation signal
MKKLRHRPSEPQTGQPYWRSLDDLAETPEFRQWIEREFPVGASELSDPVSRRQFVKLMSASFMLAGLGLTGCRRPEAQILPYSRMPENYVHGVPQYYATAMPVRDSAIPLVVKSHDGRPTKIEGNSLHPDSNGATDHFAQASILNLYDPDRATRFQRNGTPTTREAALEALREISLSFGKAYQGLRTGDQLPAASSKAGGQGLFFLLERSGSPSRARLQKLISERLPRAKWFVYEPVDFDVHRQAATLAFGNAVKPYFRLDAARVIVSLDCDFIGGEPDAYLHIRRFVKGRQLHQPSDALNRLYAVEALFTLTGANADHRLRVPASNVIGVAAQLASELFALAGLSGRAQLLTLKGFPALDVKPGWIEACAKDLLTHRGESLVMAGHRQPLAVHLLAHAMNVTLGNVGKTVVLHGAAEAGEGSIIDLARALNGGEVDTLVILGGNPVYNAPADLDWAKTQRQAKTVVRLGYYEDETAAFSDLHLPLAHYLESWGDARTADGTLVPVQPLIEPLFGGMTELEVLARLGGLDRTSPYDVVRDTFRGIAGDGEDRWKQFLHNGYLADSAAAPVQAAFDWDGLAKAVASVQAWARPTVESIEVIFQRDYKLDDGRHNNNGWLQELPDPVTKMTWENVILLSKNTADALGVVIVDKQDHNLLVPVLRITADGRALEGPAWIQPGMADGVVALGLGYGRSATGRVGKGSGYNAYTVRTTAAPWILRGVETKLTLAGRSHQLATTQNHGAMAGRAIIREATFAEYEANPQFAQGMDVPEPREGRPLYPNPLDVPDANGVTPRAKACHQWGMAIDLNACVGCAACMVACQSENNVPIVGKDQVARNREMHWLRLDRYYVGDVQEPRMLHQPMLCQHCESAPCENVCPVNATVHNFEGLNVMVYNRCVGTRYCSNNCPYKVRRFNFFDYHRRPLAQLKGPFYPSPIAHATDGEWDLKRWWKNPDGGYKPAFEWDLLKLVANPDVTVRMRGVMEKCTFCLQRIEQAKIAQKIKAGTLGEVEVPDGTIQTACQQACPAGAIVFGNRQDPNSRVSQLKQQPRNYPVLEFLATQPRLTYLARVRNPNPAIPDNPTMPWTSRRRAAKDCNSSGAHGGAEPPAHPGGRTGKGAC